MRRIHICFTPKQYAKLKAHERDTGMRLSELIRRAVDKYLESKKP